jgi:hypothetical protein
MRILAAGLVAMAALGASSLAIPSIARAQPRGSYAETCRDASASGGVLSAQCLDARGRPRQSSLGYSSCRGDISNQNGVLSCPGGTAAPSARGRNDYYPQGAGDVRRQPRDQGYDQGPAYPDRGNDRDRDRGSYDDR